VRLDGAWGAHDRPAMVEDGIYDLLSPRIDSTWSFGGGIGRYFTQTIRGDITYDHRFETDVTARMGSALATFPGGRQFGLASDLVLANLYYDFDMRSRFTPYVGIGLGMVHHQTKAGATTDECGTCTATIGGSSNWNVAGALMAGFSVAVFDRAHFDAGYRFLYLGETKAGNIVDATTGSISRGPTVEDIHAHEFRFGVRYDLR